MFEPDKFDYVLYALVVILFAFIIKDYLNIQAERKAKSVANNLPLSHVVCFDNKCFDKHGRLLK